MDSKEIRERVKQAILRQFEEIKELPIDAQMLGGKWYAPIWGCDTLDHIIDAIYTPLSTIDSEAIRRECAEKIDDELAERLCENFLLRSSGETVEDENGDDGEQAYIYDRPRLKAELIKNIRVAILGTEPAQDDVWHCTKEDAEKRAASFQSKKPAQDDGKADWLTTEAVNAGLEVGFKELGASETAKELYRNNPITNRIAHTIFSEVKRRLRLEEAGE